MVKFQILALLLAGTITSFSQTNLNIHQYKVSELVKSERDSGGELYQKDVRYFSEPGIAQPIVYRRSQQNLPDLLSYFYFYEKDSSVSYVLYEWDDQNFGNKQAYSKIPYSKIQFLINKFQDLHNQLLLKYGEGIYRRDQLDSLKIETVGVSCLETWHPNDSTDIRLEASFSNKLEHHGAMTIAPTAKIRLYVQNVEKSKEGKDQNAENLNLELPNSSFREFMKYVWLKKPEDAKKFLSDAARGKVTNEQLSELGRIIKNDSLEIYMSGYQIIQDGSHAVMIQYKYKNETSMPPKILIRVLFDSSNKILGISPTKLLK